ncbi:hypothetical protein AOQ84DRAFT_351779 [Glonium stellatum]|uniref:Uncharacterized protein n=1 Tax=Glonium stellatum TaxID=574774 RepID=A0A8E2JY80_9PEZI|nr:hypothetical protein AOQ84DRAFT_351779 [Glonium stellatum]
MQTFPMSAEPLIGNPTVALSNGYTSVIPQYEMLSQERGVDSEGKYVVTNSRRLIAAVGTGLTDYGVDVSLLGGVFLSQNYLVVDYAKNKFSLTPAVIGTVNRVSEDLRTVCENSINPASPTTALA